MRTNSPRVHDRNVDYARVMGERVNMNREGLTGLTRTDPVRIRYADMSRPDPRPYRGPVAPVRRRYRVAPPTYPTFGYVAEYPDLCEPHPEPKPLPLPPRRKRGPLAFGSAPRVVERTTTVRPELPPPPAVRDGADLYVLRVRYADGGTDWFTYTKRERAEGMARRELAMGSAVQLRARG